jgi:hypothetical protein
MPGVVGEDFDLKYFQQGKRFQDYFNDVGRCSTPLR